MAVLLVRLLAVLLAATTAVTAQIRSDLTPNNPAVAPGETLVLNCTLNEDDLSQSAKVHDIDFFKNQKPIDSKYVTILDGSTAQLRLPNVTKELNQKFILCKINDNLLGMQIVTVIIRPVVPKITKCIVSDSSMRCEWSPTGKNQTPIIRAKVTDNLEWRTSGDPDGTWNNCSKQESGECLWPPEIFVKDAVYTIRIEASYSHDSVYGIYTINSSEIVQVAPVARISENHLNSTSVVLEWPPVESNQDILYRINFSHSAIGYENLTKTFQDLQMRLDGLKPYQPYSFTLEAKTKDLGYWSPPLEYSFFALSDVPAKHPDVKEGAFSSVEKLGSPCIDVTVYWKAIAVVDQHGPEFRYEVQAKPIDHCGMRCFSWKKRATHVQVTIPKNCTVDVTVKSVNINGTSNAPPTPVRIEPANTRIPGPSNITVIASVNAKEVIVSWDKEPNDTATTGYTLYWSPRHLNNDAEMNWRAIPADTNRVVQPLPAYTSEKYDFTKFEFAVSREEGLRSSGMVLSDCTYQDGQYSPPPPSFAISKTAEPEHGELVLEWRRTQCSTHRGFVYGYTLHYCQTAEHACPEDPSQQTTVYISSSETSAILTGLTEKARYCVTVTSLTSKGPSRVQSEPRCAIVPGPWWTPGIIVGFTLGGIVVLLLVIFGIVKFGSHCHRLYSKFQQGIRVELPRTTYSTQFSVSSHKELIDQNHSFSYNVEDYSSPGLAKQHSQDSTADSGRGSMTQDHIHPAIRRSNSGEFDEVFLVKNGLQANGTARIRQSSEPMGGYARVMHNSEPQVTSDSTASLVTPSPVGKPKLPARNLPVNGTVSISMSSLPQQYNPSMANGSIPSYVMVGGNSQAGGDYSLNEDSSMRDCSVNSSPISDYTRANGETPILNYIIAENEGQEEYIQTPAVGQDFHPALLRNQAPGNQGNVGYVTSPEAANQGAPLGYVASPEAANHGAPLGYVTSPEAANHGAPLGYVTSPEAANHGAPLGYVTSPEATNPGVPLGYVTSPEAANHGAPLGYVTSPKAANQGAPLGYVTSPEAANQGAPLGYVTSPEAANQGAPLGYVTSPEAANQGAPLGYVTSPEAANQGAPLGYVTSPEAANQPLSDVTNLPAGLAHDTGGYVSAPGTDLEYVQTGDTAPLAASTPHVLTDSCQGPPWGSDRDNALCKPQQLQKQVPRVDSAYVSLPPSTDSTCSGRTDSIPAKEIRSRNSDANHNEVANSGVYVKPVSDNDIDRSSDLMSTQRSNEPQTDLSEDSDETSSLLPSDGGHRVLNKSGYVVIDT